MKRNNHPGRSKSRRHVSATERAALAVEGYTMADIRKRPQVRERFPKFPRARRLRLGDLLQAGYRTASVASVMDWRPAVDWIMAHCRDAGGNRTATWFGGNFVFANPADQQRFCQRFDPAAGYQPLFAFKQRSHNNQRKSGDFYA